MNQISGNNARVCVSRSTKVECLVMSIAISRFVTVERRGAGPTAAPLKLLKINI